MESDPDKNPELETQLILSDKFLQKSYAECPETIFECGIECNCDPLHCQNRLVQQSKGKMNVKLSVKNTEKKGYGVFACHDILKGTYLGNYSGEVVIKENLNNDEWDNDYLFDTGEGLAIDARKSGNVLRFLNHDCKNMNVASAQSFKLNLNPEIKENGQDCLKVKPR